MAESGNACAWKLIPQAHGRKAFWVQNNFLASKNYENPNPGVMLKFMHSKQIVNISCPNNDKREETLKKNPGNCMLSLSSRDIVDHKSNTYLIAW